MVRFENLTGDATLEWTARAVGDLLSQALTGALDGPLLARPAIVRLSASLGIRPAGAPGISAERTAAQAAGATRVITGYIEKTAGGLRISGAEEDLGTGKTVRSMSATSPDAVHAVTELARAFSPKAAAPRTQNEQALRLYFTSREADTQAAIPLLEQAVAADPDFGDAWVALAEGRRSLGDRPGAESTIANARSHKLDKLDLAYLDFLAATMEGDPGSARLDAMKRVSDLSPGDTVLLRSLAEAQSGAGQFAQSAASWKKLSEVLPSDVDVVNQLGYTLAWSGDYAGALAAMTRYGQMRPAEPNPLDSLGDVHFLYRKFPEAAAAYLRAHAKAPAFEAGGDLYKAAWAKFLAGDKAGADAMFAQFRQAREKGTNFALVSADWLYRTGRRKEAVAELRNALANAAPADQPTLHDELAIFELLAGNRAAAVAEAAAVGPPGTPGSLLIRFCTLPSASASEWETRAARMMPAPGAVALRELAVGYALLLDGKKEAALPVWKDISDKARANDFALRSVYQRLRGEPIKLTVPPDPSSVNPFAAVLDR